MTRTLRPELVIHQEGAIAALAAVGLILLPGAPLPALAPVGTLPHAVALGMFVGVLACALLRLGRSLRPLRLLERWQRTLFRGWSVTDVLVVALVSSLAEEALMRALLQPLVGLVPAALLFSVLHVVPDCRLWFWPAMALVLGIVLGLLYRTAGYPAAAAAHFVVNGVGLLRLRR